MTRKLTFAIALAAATAVGSLVAADEPLRNESPFRTAEYTQSDSAQTVQVRNWGRSYRGNYYNNRRYNYNYSPYRYGYRYNYSPYYSPYGYRYNSRYGNRYYNYGGGGVRFGNFGVWW